MNRSSKILVAGHTGLVGSAMKRRLEEEGYTDIATASWPAIDLTDQRATNEFMAREKPSAVFLCAAKVGGILANSTFPADFIYQNVMIAANVIHASFRHGARKLLNLGSSCIYPRLAPQPIREEYLLTDELEPTNEPYAIAKIAAIKLCSAYNRQHGTNFISVMPTNLYGPGDNFDLETSHVLPAMIRRFHEAKENGAPAVTLWGTGTPRREFLYVDDLAAACVHLMTHHDARALGEFVNIGTGTDLTIAELAGIVARVVGYEGEMRWDRTRPDGTPQKLLDVSRIHDLGWRASVGLEEGIQRTYRWFLDNLQTCRGVS
ncbi:MAG TPA: GDP-L-fucose synthase [Deltaproteobacteria bacterium]|mgnify:FL=1|nr:MAG: GDP-L-fucose synthase [Deltaproteobacteria bacterium ADurb.Bin072]HNQ86538.1 GDP-L-fucose synthase [Deltaproteobacteria bacterium]HNS90852.1 GDP-L-fucose synthase [Deltaproteobacteria bacterium]HNY66741.1 GDP-L-fucose synthase [Deltaproteobacteria bacterium]HPH51791.1 GDP-L-fucose synthase [Deltaproteobacteria bacterium]